MRLRRKARADSGTASPRASACSRTRYHAGIRRLDGADRPCDQRSQTPIDEGLHDRRQHQQEPVEASVRLDDEKARYPAYAKFQKAGLRNVLSTRTLPAIDRKSSSPTCSNIRRSAMWRRPPRIGPPAQLHIYHGGYRFGRGRQGRRCWNQFETTGRIEWITDLPNFRRNTV